MRIKKKKNNIFRENILLKALVENFVEILLKRPVHFLYNVKITTLQVKLMISQKSKVGDILHYNLFFFLLNIFFNTSLNR